MFKFVMRILVVVVFFSMQSFVHAQEITINGKVKDESGLPIPGVSVLVKGSTIGTITDIDGSFSFDAPTNSNLVFSFIGYETQEILATTSYLEVVLKVDNQKLDEVVVTALGIKREKKSLGYSVTEVKSEELTVTREVNAINALSGKVAGVQINQPTSGPTGSTRVVIRGISEIDGDNQPLYVVDGVPMDNTNFGQADEERGYDMSSGISDINPDDIESLSVLKGASAAALYGSRALNGVVLITTKKGRERKGIGVEVNSNFTFDHIQTGYEDIQYEFGMGANGRIPDTKERAANWSAMWGDRFAPNKKVTIFDGSTKPYLPHKDNIQDFFRTGFTNTNTINLTGGDEKSTYRLGISNLQSKDILPKTKLQRTTFTFRGTSELSDKLSVDTKVTYITDKVKNRPQLSNAGIGANLLYMPNNYDVSWLKNHSDPNGVYYKWTGYIGRENPFWVLDNVENQSRKKRILAFTDVKYKITDKLVFKVKAGTDFYSNKFFEISNKSEVLGDRPGRMIERNMDVSEENYEALLSYNNTFGDFTVSANAGANKMKYKFTERHLEGTGVNTANVVALDNYNDPRITPILSRKIINSVYAFGQVGYKNFLYLDLTQRYDWSSTLPSANRPYGYPSVSTSFIFTDAFKLTSKVLTFAKLRASWAEVGGDTEPFRLALNYRGGKPFHGKSTISIDSDDLPNANLKPEKTTSYEFGTDMRFFGNRLGVDFTYYHKKTINQILLLPLTKTMGYKTAIVNAGEIINKGVELLVTAQPIKTNDFSWDLAFTYSKNKNKVKEIHKYNENFEIENARWAEATINANEGGTFGEIMGKRLQRTSDGQIIHSEDGLPLVTNEKYVLGKASPDWIGGVNSTMKYKGLSLKMAFDVRMGGEIYSMTNLRLYSTGLHKNTLEGRDKYREWYAKRRAFEQANPNANMTDWEQSNPVQGHIGKGVINVGTAEKPNYIKNNVQADPAKYWGQYSSAPEPFIYDASYIKLRSLSLGYQLPKTLIANLPIESMTISAIATNLWILYKKVPNIDPESTYNNGNGQGLEYGSFPGRKSWGFNINVKF